MNIIYDRNPLFVKIYLDDKEKEIFKWKYIARQLEDNLFSVQYHLTSKKDYPIKDALVYCKEIADFEEYAQSSIDALTDQHVGDCTAFPCSCEKCYAEDVLGVCTAPPSKYIGNAIFSVYSEYKNLGAAGNETETIMSMLKNKQLEHPKYYTQALEYYRKYSIEHSYLIE